MFDIKEYYSSSDNQSAKMEYEIEELDSNLTDDIESLVSNRFDKLYLTDRYKYQTKVINIIHPSLSYPGNQSIIITPDKIRYLLSFYPNKRDLGNVDRIVVRPRFIEVGDIELASLFLREKKTLVMYLINPYLYRLKSSLFSNFLTVDIESNGASRIAGKKSNDDDGDIFVHPLWYILSQISSDSINGVDKFFIKGNIKPEGSKILNDISFFFTRHGY